MAGYKVLALSQEMFTYLWRGKHPGYKIIQNPIPNDAKVVEVVLNKQTGEIEFMLYSEKYEWVKTGSPVPFAPVPMYAPWKEPS